MEKFNKKWYKQKTPKELLSHYGDNDEFTLLNFWKSTVPDILNDITRERFAEIIVGSALEYDSDRIRIKSAAYINNWKQKKLSSVSFSMQAKLNVDSKDVSIVSKNKNRKEIYVFCLLANKNHTTIDPLKLEQWNFYVLPNVIIDKYKKCQNSITLYTLNKLTSSIKYCDLKSEITMCYNQ